MIFEIIFAVLADRLLFSCCRMSDARKVYCYVAMMVTPDVTRYLHCRFYMLSAAIAILI